MAEKRTSKGGPKAGKANGSKSRAKGGGRSASRSKGSQAKGSGAKDSRAKDARAKGSSRQGSRSRRERNEKRGSEERRTGGRPVWTGTLAFGLVTLPVELYPTTRSGGVSLRMIAPDGTPLSRRYYCERDGELLTSDEIVRGYPVGDEEFVIVEDEELEALDPDSSRVIDLDVFVPIGDLDPSYVENTYVLVPGRDAATAYRLLVASMAKEGRAGIATFVMRGRSYLMAIVSRAGTLRGLTLRYHDEVRTPADVGLPELETADVEDVARIERAAKRIFENVLDEDELEDEEAQRITELAERKLESGEDVHAARDADDEDDEELDEDLEATLVDVMELLRKSLGKAARA